MNLGDHFSIRPKLFLIPAKTHSVAWPMNHTLTRVGDGRGMYVAVSTHLRDTNLHNAICEYRINWAKWLLIQIFLFK